MNQTNVRHLQFGYLRLHLLMTETELTDTKERLHYFAQCEGYSLGTVFVEQDHTVPAGFEALIAAVKHYDARAVVVPSLQHLAVLGTPPALRLRREATPPIRRGGRVEQSPHFHARSAAPRPPTEPRRESIPHPSVVWRHDCGAVRAGSSPPESQVSSQTRDALKRLGDALAEAS